MGPEYFNQRLFKSGKWPGGSSVPRCKNLIWDRINVDINNLDLKCMSTEEMQRAVKDQRRKAAIEAKEAIMGESRSQLRNNADRERQP